MISSYLHMRNIMCKIYSTRKSNKYVYISMEDEENDYGGVKKIRIDKFLWAKKFKNVDFLCAVSLPTTVEKDEDDATIAVPFVDEDITYSVDEF